MNNMDDATIMVTHDAGDKTTPHKEIEITNERSGEGAYVRAHDQLPFTSTHQAHPYLNLLRTMYHEINQFSDGSLPQVRQLKQTLIETMDYHTRLLSEQGVENTHIIIVRYMISTFIDDNLSNLPWQENITWADSSLLHYYYKETYGGEKFFQLLKQFMSEPNKYRQHIELAFICISLGYKGKFAIDKGNGGKIELEKIRNELYAFIQNQPSNNEKFYGGHPVSREYKKTFLHIPYKLFLLGGILLMGVVYAILTNTISTNEKVLLETITSQHKGNI